MHRSLIMFSAAAFGLAAPVLAQQSPPVSADSKAGTRALLDEDVVTVRNVTRAEIVHGIEMLDDDGNLIGTVERLAGNDVIVSDETAQYRIPINRIYAFSKDGADRYASRLPKSRLKAEPLPPPPPPPPAPPPPPLPGQEEIEGGPEGGSLPDDTVEAPSDEATPPATDEAQPSAPPADDPTQATPQDDGPPATDWTPTPDPDQAVDPAAAPVETD